MDSTHIIIVVWVVINVVSFLVVANDKRKSIQGGHVERTPEGLLFFMATIFGGVGVYTAMLLFRHKTKRWYFQIGMPFLILQNIALLYLGKLMFF